MKLTGRAVLITGGTRIGKAVVAALASAGADVALSYHSSKGIAEQTVASRGAWPLSSRHRGRPVTLGRLCAVGK